MSQPECDVDPLEMMLYDMGKLAREVEELWKVRYEPSFREQMEAGALMANVRDWVEDVGVACGFGSGLGTGVVIHARPNPRGGR